ncbi:hypothetical protein [Nocardia carnea]|uniref:hypothetical protein n=1 Tax=Nocardia carnea TaxID=37328 RepID=UPI00245827E7|nr:hypothetical protein [Nocardia carnea]
MEVPVVVAYITSNMVTIGRSMGLGLAAIADVLGGTRTVPEAVASERVAVEAELAALSWRHAVLTAVAQADDPRMLPELAAVAERGAARSSLIDFWRRILAAMPASAFDGFVDMDIPQLPAAPSPHHILLFAELGRLTRSPELAREVSRQMIAADPPGAGPELDLYVAAHAAARGRRDTEGFRRELAGGVTFADRTAARYWALTAEALGTTRTTGDVQRWLDTALLRALEPSGG